MGFEISRCACGSPIVDDHISVKPGEDKPCVRIAIATICPMCRRISEVRMAPYYKGKVQLFQVDKLYRATRLNNFSEEELRTGKVSGFNIPDGYNPDAFHETKGQEDK